MTEEMKRVCARILSEEADPEETADALARQRVLDEFTDKRNQIARFTWVFLSLEIVQLAVFVALFAMVSNTKILIALAVLIILSFETTLLMKLWYWVVHTRILLVREVKEMRLELGELASRFPFPAPSRDVDDLTPDNTPKA